MVVTVGLACWGSTAAFGLPFRTDTSGNCRASLEQAIGDGTLEPVDGKVEALFQGADSWEGRTPMCWVHISSGGTCETFGLDLEGRWAPARWQHLDSLPEPCDQLGT